MFNLVIAQADGNEGVSTALESVKETLPWVQQAEEFLTEHAYGFGMRLVAALAILLIGRFVVGLIMSGAARALKKTKVDEILIRFAQNVLKAVLMIVVIMAALQTMGVELTALTAVLAASGFAVGMALQSQLSNFAAGILLVVVKPFRVGDAVDAAGVSGKVVEIQLFNCKLRTFDGILMTVPNGQITSSVIKNFSTEPVRRIDLVIGCGYGDDLLAVKQLLNDILNSHGNVLAEPEPLVGVDELGDSSVNFIVRPWVKTEDFGSTKRELTEQIKLAFDAKGFNFPYPSRDLYMHQ